MYEPCGGVIGIGGKFPFLLLLTNPALLGYNVTSRYTLDVRLRQGVRTAIMYGMVWYVVVLILKNK